MNLGLLNNVTLVCLCSIYYTSSIAMLCYYVAVKNGLESVEGITGLESRNKRCLKITKIVALFHFQFLPFLVFCPL